MRSECIMCSERWAWICVLGGIMLGNPGCLTAIDTARFPKWSISHRKYMTNWWGADAQELYGERPFYAIKILNNMSLDWFYCKDYERRGIVVSRKEVYAEETANFHLKKDGVQVNVNEDCVAGDNVEACVWWKSGMLNLEETSHPASGDPFLTALYASGNALRRWTYPYEYCKQPEEDPGHAVIPIDVKRGSAGNTSGERKAKKWEVQGKYAALGKMPLHAPYFVPGSPLESNSLPY